nr:MAG TPA: hypothetical protein [Caudoviricetes sp.]
MKIPFVQRLSHLCPRRGVLHRTVRTLRRMGRTLRRTRTAHDCIDRI